MNKKKAFKPLTTPMGDITIMPLKASNTFPQNAMNPGLTKYEQD